MPRILAFAATLAVLALPAQAQDVADRILVGGPVLTMNDAQPRAEAVAIRDGLIIAVGTAEEIEAFLHSLPGITRAAVLPVPDPKRGHALVAILQGDPQQEAAILTALRQALGPLKAPKALIWRFASACWECRGRPG